MNQMTT